MRYFVLIFSLLSIAASAQSLVVKTAAGYVKGISEEQSIVFKGIPYAAPPIGVLRFKVPQPANKWKDTLLCDKFGSVSSQYAGKGLRGSEDCLTLNVYTPSRCQKKMPVVVWVHGGAFTMGSGMNNNGHAFADRDSIVTVTINYRLGVFGFLYLGDVNPAYRASGNNGLLDLIMALKWIRQNIEAFGGDPARVTVMGESAGAKLTSTLLTTKAADGLYSQLVLESGGVQCIRDSVTAKSIRQRLLDTLHLSKPADLLALPTDQLIIAQNKVLHGAQGTNYFGPVQDGVIITDDPYRYIQNHVNRKVRFLIGSNKRESQLFLGMDNRLQHPDAKTLEDWFGLNYPLVMAAYEKRSQQIRPDSAAGEVLTQYMYQMHSYRLAGELALTANPVWMYRFDYSKDGLGATHGEELPYVWYVPGKHADKFNEPLAQEMHKQWGVFIKGQQPQGWPLYQPVDKTVVIFNNAAQAVKLNEVYDDKNYPSAGFILK